VFLRQEGIDVEEAVYAVTRKATKWQKNPKEKSEL